MVKSMGISAILRMIAKVGRACTTEGPSRVPRLATSVVENGKSKIMYFPRPNASMVVAERYEYCEDRDGNDDNHQ